MEVTNKNFKDVLPQVQAAVDQADFLALDTELTGLGTGEFRPHALDLPEERYHKLRKGAMEFHIIQFGLATFRYDPDNQKYLCQVFNFYIFPRPFSRQAPDVRFTCQASSLDFLCNHDFDFNKCIKEGVSYLRPDHEEKLKTILKEKHEAIKSMQQMSPGFSSPCVDGSQPVKGPVSVPEEQQPYINGICDKVEKFINSKEEALPLSPVNGFLRKLVYQTVNMKFGSQVHLQTKTKENKQRYIEIRRVGSKDDIEQLEKARRQAELDELDDATGFTKVIQMLSLSRKVIIGHNMLLDVMHILHRFRCSLPESYEDFKALTHCVFPRLLDTKNMASASPLKDVHITNTGLGELYKLLQNEPFVKPVIEFEENCPGYSDTEEKLHDAGYDAYVTGCCFIGMTNYLGSKENSTFCVTRDSPIVEPYVNKLHLMWVYDIRYINIAGKDGQESRSHVFHLTFPSDWRNTDLNQLFSSFGPVFVTWIDDTSAFVTLQNRSVAQMVMSQLSPGENYHIIPYSEYKEKKSWSAASGVTKSHNRVPASDVQLPSKRKRSLDGASSFPSRRSITPIAEEDETMEEDAAKNDEDTGVPVKRTKLEKNGSGDNVFTAPEKW